MRQDEVRELRAICEPGLVLLGFRPATQLDGLQHVKPASFIYPEENWIKGRYIPPDLSWSLPPAALRASAAAAESLVATRVVTGDT